MADHDLTFRLGRYLDRHLLFPLLEFLQEKQLYSDEEILKGKIELLQKTNMVDFAMDIHKSLYDTEEVPEVLKVPPRPSTRISLLATAPFPRAPAPLQSRRFRADPSSLLLPLPLPTTLRVDLATGVAARGAHHRSRKVLAPPTGRQKAERVLPTPGSGSPS